LGAALQLDAVRRRAAGQRTEQADRQRLLGRRRGTSPDDSEGDGENDEDREAGSWGHGSPPSAESGNDRLAEELQRAQDPLVRRAAGMPEADQEVIGADLAVPRLHPLDAVFRRAENEALERDALEVEVLLLL